MPESFTGGGKIIRAIRELQQHVFGRGPRSTPGALVSRTTRGDLVQPTAKPSKVSRSTASAPSWR